MAYAYMPITLAMTQRRCLVVGGGAVAARKVDALLNYEASVIVVAPEVDDRLVQCAEQGWITWEKRPYRPGEVAGYGLVIAASGDNDVNRRVSEDCRTAGVLVNVVDDPKRCDFAFPAVVRRGCLTAAIATDGQAPFMARHLRSILASIFPEHWTQVMHHAADFRRRVQKRWGADVQKKEACYDRFLEADWKSLLEQKSEEDIDRELAHMVE
ncbi:MAG: bifunctional precorrin-2 dehydrogenase/sirohydrochlorin ferrochelatase [Candidatus Zixiibacteriota bacterium]